MHCFGKGLTNQKIFLKDLKLEYIPDKKETHHIELFNSQEDHKG